MPLTDTPWARGKCGYKLIQYMACGLPVIASPIGVNVDIVKVEYNGLLASTTDQWYEALENLISNSSLRAEMGARGRLMVEQTYCVQVQSKRLNELLSF